MTLLEWAEEQDWLSTTVMDRAERDCLDVEELFLELTTMARLERVIIEDVETVDYEAVLGALAHEIILVNAN